MKINFDKQKQAEKLSGLVSSTVDLGKKAAANTKNSVNSLVEKSKSDSYARRLKKYNPLFPDQYLNPEFNLPNMIVIVDDAERRGIDVCEGAIGWLSKDTGIEMLHLYDEAVEFSGLKFVPVAACDAVYYVDNFDRTRFIRIDCIFSKAHEERMAELKHIAHSLGAKRCSIEICESIEDTRHKSKEFSLTEKFKGVSNTESRSQEFSSSQSRQIKGRIEAEFEGSDAPVQPVLKWFSNDDSIIRLIEMRCSGNNTIKSETLELAGSSSSTMSQKTAYAIDGAIGKLGGVKGTASMSDFASKEHSSRMLFCVEF